MKSDENPLADLVLTREHIYLLDDADFQAFTARLNHRRGADVRLVASDGVVIVAPVEGWRVCECDFRSDGSDWCDDCREEIYTDEKGR